MSMNPLDYYTTWESVRAASRGHDQNLNLLIDPNSLNPLYPQNLDHPASANDRQVAGTHYKDMGVEPWDVVDTWPIEQRIGAYRHGALKYLMRMGTKDEQLQEIRKSAHYIEKLIEVLEHADTQAQEGAGTQAP